MTRARSKHMKYLFTLAIASISLAGCRQSDPAITLKPKDIDPDIAQIRASVPKPDTKTGSYAKVFSANNEFSLKLLKQLIKESPGKNLAASPISLTQDFAMLYDCSKGAVHDAVGKLLGVNGFGPNDLAYFHSQLNDEFDKDPLRTLTMANGLWLSEQYKIDASQAKRMEALFGCTVKPLVKDRAQAKKELDLWVSDHTDGMIKEIQTELVDETTAMFLNALLFNGKWEQPFEESDTKPRDFHGFDGTIQVPTLLSSSMEREAGKNGSYTGLKLPFSAKGFSFLVILPDDKSAFDKLPSLLTSQWLDEFAMGLSHGEEEVSLPKLNLYSKLNLIPTIKSMGGSSVFDYGLDLSPLVPVATPVTEETRIYAVFQQVKLELAEKGVKAAAVTEIGVKTDSAMPMNPIKVHVDRPFYFFVMHGNTIVLCGAIYDPSKE